MSSVFFNKGENCISAGRLFVEDKIHDEFVKKVLQNIKTMRIGEPEIHKLLLKTNFISFILILCNYR